jgi:Leucine-rich repeat (LRR) protein
LENLDVGKTNFSGRIPASVGNLISLKKLGLGAQGFFGELPSSIGNLTSLRELEISGMGIVGSMPPWVANLTSLTSLRFYECGLSGSIPSFLGDLRHLKELLLCECNFSGHLPSHISNLTQLQVLFLYANNFMGTVELTFITNLPNLMYLDLSNNNLVVLDGENNSSLTSFPKLRMLGLQSCGLSKFPNFLRHQDEISSIDLSYNNIHGSVPSWGWETWNQLYTLRLGNNNLTSIGSTSSLLPLQVDLLDLSSNMFEGPIPIPLGYALILDYSNNMFSSVPSDFSSHLIIGTLFLASGNNLSGEIPSSFCGGTSIELLDLSYNKFTGAIPSCLMENVNGMQSLYLKENKLTGKLPDTIKDGCSFKALDFSGNWIEGRLPRSLLACKYLEVLDVGNNQISGSFPCWMSALPGLEVLVLKSNKLSGQVAQSLGGEKSSCAFPSAIILDLSSNNFSGTLPQGEWFQGFKSMIFTDPNKSLVMERTVLNPGTSYRYEYTTVVTYKGHDTTFSKILRTLVFIDMSNNAFSGSIPEGIGELRLLHGLNISHNFLSGPIPSQLGELRQLEALDLSFNQLSGEIPQELASLDFLTTLNLSNNKLVGSIPESPQFMTFSNGSFIGNDGLCGPPLSKQCMNKTIPNVVSHHSEKKSANIITFLFAGIGFGVGFAIAIVVAWGIPIRKQSQERQ